MLLLLISLVVVGVAAWELFWVGYFAVCFVRLMQEEKFCRRTRKLAASTHTSDVP